MDQSGALYCERGGGGGGVIQLHEALDIVTWSL